ncbi:SAM-dependent methyltransferase [Frondihabitans sp. PAMC 28766]|uniref:methyltransferase domain-containing protein n=1 Tax=Frondihabitans sp. PAMC 28766 TaxID=1795630 RepID=UPI00078BBE09|nr:class I SAM-dependent methyltransferase [Frondihabitans sp. PAMC 28766]AMM20140.1 SAM-dependent methyltransferase [Frondihabitans sp. PAMC 28766]
MSIVIDDTLLAGREATFGAGGSEPYAHALGREGRLTLVGSSRTGVDYDLGRWMAEADDVDRALLASETGPVLDIGCGPGRMVQAATDLGLVALGVDVSKAAVRVAGRAGLPVLNRSVFDRLPREGHWGTMLLIDGNIGIGGDPRAMLERCRELLGRRGAAIVEVQSDDDVDETFMAHVVDDDGRSSSSFPWAELGTRALERHAAAAGFDLEQTWRVDGRTFCRLVCR